MSCTTESADAGPEVSIGTALGYDDLDSHAPIAWRVMTHPSAIVLGTLRTGLVQLLWPELAAITADHDPILREWRETGRYPQGSVGRFKRTVSVPMPMVIGTTEEALATGIRLRRYHDTMTAREPVSGRTTCAGDVDNMVWAHVTTWHSYLIAYEVFGGQQLTAEERDRYFAEGAHFARSLGIPDGAVPVTVAGVRDYFASVRPRLTVSEDARRAYDYFVDPRPQFRSRTELSMTAALPVLHLMNRAALATLPQHVRKLVGHDGSKTLDLLAIAMLRPIFIVAGLPVFEDQLHRFLRGQPGVDRVHQVRAVLAGLHA